MARTHTHGAAIILLAMTACVGSAESVLQEPPPPDLTNTLSTDVIGISAGDEHSCALNRDGSIACWGAYMDPSYDDPWHFSRLLTPPYGSFTTIDSGESYSCALRIDGAIACWGSDLAWPEITQPPPGHFVDISIGSYHACALRNDRTAMCWGRNSYGESSPPAGTFVDLSVGLLHTCGVRDNGSVECWGMQEGDYWHFGQPPTGTFVSVTAENSGFETCGIQADGYATCWSGLEISQLPAEPFVSLTAAQGDGCGIKADGSIYCWGFGWLTGPHQPVGDFIAIDAGPQHACAVRTDGGVACWGRNWFGETDVPPAVAH